jgi:hypothetical protein
MRAMQSWYVNMNTPTSEIYFLVSGMHDGLFENYDTILYIFPWLKELKKVYIKIW